MTGNRMPPIAAQQPPARDHGGGIDAAARRYGGARADWIDLSTGINPVPYPLPPLPPEAWTALPDHAAQTALTLSARALWSVPDGAAILAAPGASALIARIPALHPAGTAHIPGPTYNEHAAAFRAHGWQITETGTGTPAQAQVAVHPNNPTGAWADPDTLTAPLCIIDESFCDIAPDRSLIAQAARPGCIVIKSFGKFWGLAGMRLGFAIGDPALIDRLAGMLGPWPVSGPALRVGQIALSDTAWAKETRARLAGDAARLDALMTGAGARVQGGTPLFRLYHVGDAQDWQTRLAHAHIWTRTFPYSRHWLRLGLPAPDDWPRIEAAL
ncbi:threonine-phosphate decarboxylase [Sediminimonas qiaohouensis]|uniref:threonine-phosphate decarboxylase n=1 Tax=Sediminimonas qiaohouensis TaxID=552061 RepID=UPI0003FDE880|nr:threonine-phosphate decarboxylase [Sediminimonas qiaohouensis]